MREKKLLGGMTINWEKDWHRLIKRDPPAVIAKDYSPLMDELDEKKKKKLKKTLQSVEPTEFFGQDFTKLGELIEMLNELDLIKSDNKLKKKVKGFDETNLDIVSKAAKLRKDYETLYRQLRTLIYPKRKGDIRND